MKIQTITPDALAARLTDGGEIALLDVRDEARLLAGIPCRQCTRRWSVCSIWRRASSRAARRHSSCAMTAMARQAAEYELFETGHAMANCFGLAVQASYATPRIDGSELMRRQAAGEPLLIVDSCPRRGVSCGDGAGRGHRTGAELFHRIPGLVPDAETPDAETPGAQTTVVVHSGGKTRGILGCQSLIGAGLPNPVVALDEGTMDWVLAGGRLEVGADRSVAPSSEAAKASAV